MIDTSTTYLGPARLAGARVELPDGRTLAARRATPFVPAEGDRVLVIANDDEVAWILGIVEGSGPLTLEAERGLALRSPRSIELVSPEVRVRAGRLELWATRIVQKSRDFLSWVSGLSTASARRYKLDVEETARVRAGRADLRAKDTMTIDGSTIHLG